MTKERPPLTHHLALTRIAGLLGWDRCAKITGKAERTLLNWSDPDTSAGINMEAARILDREYRAAGGEGLPLHECQALLLELDVTEACSSNIERAERTAHAAEETGEALAAQIRASVPGAAPALRLIAARETEQAIAALTQTLPGLGAGPGLDVPARGGSQQ